MTKMRLILVVALAPAVALAGVGASVLKAQDQPATAHAVVADGQSSPLEKMGKAKSTVMAEIDSANPRCHRQQWPTSVYVR